MTRPFTLFAALSRLVFVEPDYEDGCGCHACSNVLDLLAVPDLLAYASGRNFAQAATSAGSCSDYCSAEGLRVKK